MTLRKASLMWAVLLVLCGAGWAQRRGKSPDDRLAAAKRFVEQSDRYLHHSKLRRGMKGYGLTVLAGTEIVKFKAEVVSVVTRWGMHQDVILARLSEQNLEHTGIIAGMSGSPVYFPDPADGKYKLVGAVAYGWSGNKDPVGGIQPITQMLAVGNTYLKFAEPERGGKAAAADVKADASSGGVRPDRVDDYLKTILDPRKIDFVEAFLPARPDRADPQSASPRLVPLSTPLMVTGAGSRGLADLTRTLKPMGLVPVASGGVNAVEAVAAKDVKFEPGSAIAVQLVTGDADMAAVGTVTDVANGRLLAFGHSFFGDGPVNLPIGPAYVHTPIAGLMSSFKLSTGLGVTGTLERDEKVAVAGVIGPTPAMIPMTITYNWAGEKRKETFRFNLCNHRYYTSMMTRYMLGDSAGAWHAVPERHTVRYTTTVTYDKLGTYRASNISTGQDIYAAQSDLTRPISALMNNPYGPRIPPKRIDVAVTIENGDLSASMLDFKLDQTTCRPGQTLTGTLTVRPFKKDRETIDVRFRVPGDLPEGDYSLTVCDAGREMSFRQAETPHKYFARTTQEIFDAVQRVVQPPANRLYLRLPVRDGGGVALAQQELPDLPASKAGILSQARLLDARSFRRSIVQTLDTEYIISGSAGAQFRVRKEPAETLLQTQK